MKPKALIWFRQDLRIHDNPALCTAINRGFDIIPIFILDQDYSIGQASKVWLYHSLQSLNQSLENSLIFCIGSPLHIITDLAKTLNVSYIFWNRCYESWQIIRDKQIKTTLLSLQINVETYNASLIWEPWDVLKPDHSSYKVFTSFYHKCLQVQPKRQIAHYNTKFSINCKIKSEQKNLQKNYIQTIEYLLSNLSWEKNTIKHWNVGENAASAKLQKFIKFDIKNYKIGRDFPNSNSVSKLSAHIHFGEISAQQIWHSLLAIDNDPNFEHFKRELIWREFSYHLMFYFPNLHNTNWQHKFNHFPWRNDSNQLVLWQQGLTGIPIIDAGMRELWQTGYMHNRVRMLVASFLTKNLMIDWRKGASWFFDTLFDADLANNSASWQWVAGCGADAAPYFRIFNPILQSQKFDTNGSYIKTYVPELQLLAPQYIHNPTMAPTAILQAANVKLGRDYPLPIVDIKSSGSNALQAFRLLASHQISQ
jgi:deoxyribodipyrimidine photo-lyase